MFHGLRTQTVKSDREQYLEWELDRLQDEERQRREEERRQREARRQERQWRIEERRYSAKTWPEALRKNRDRFREEAALWASEITELTMDDKDDWFAPGAEGCDRALEIWQEEEAFAAAEIAALEAQLSAIRDRIRTTTADRIEQEAAGRKAWQSIARSLRDETPTDFLHW